MWIDIVNMLKDMTHMYMQYIAPLSLKQQKCNVAALMHYTR